MKNSKLVLIAAVVILLAGWGFVVLKWRGDRTPDPAPAFIPTAPVDWENAHLGDSNDDDRYVYSALYPAIHNHPAAEDFNRAVAEIVQAEIDRFILDAAVAVESNPEGTGPGSMLDIQYGVLFNRQGLFSVVLHKTVFIEGFERPGEFDIPFNYDFGGKRVLALKDLFTPGADFFAALAATCTADLKTRIRAEDQVTPLELAPQEDSFRAWHLTPGGIEIIFSYAQLGTTTASGSLTVLIPYGEIQTLIDDKGPLKFAFPLDD